MTGMRVDKQARFFGGRAQKRGERELRVREDIARLRRGDLIVLHWIDASICRNVNMKGRLTNRLIATYKRTPGYFWQVTPDQRYAEEHLTVVTEPTDEDDVADIETIPVPIVMKVEVMQQKAAQLLVKRHPIPAQLPSGVKVKRRTIIPLPGGATEMLLRGVKTSRKRLSQRSPLYKRQCKASNTYIKKKIFSHTLPRTLKEARLANMRGRELKPLGAGLYGSGEGPSW